MLKRFFILLIVINSPVSAAESDSFSLKSLVKDDQKLEAFIGQSLKSYQLNDKKVVKEKIHTATEGLFIHKYVTNSPVFIETTFQTLNRPKVIVSGIKLFTNFNNLILLVGSMVLTFFLSHVLVFLGQFLKILGPLHIIYAFGCFLGVNYLRLKIISIYLGEHLGGFYNIFLSALAKSGEHDYLLITLNILKDLV